MAQAQKSKPAKGGAKPRDDGAKPRDAVKVIALNNKAYHDYLIRDTVEAGLVLTGTEIKSIRAGKVNLREAYARVENGEAWLHNMHVAQYDLGNRWNHPPIRPRKLLLHKTQIRDLLRETKSKGLTMVPVRLYIARDRAKIELAVAQGKKVYDKRQTMAEREAARDIERAVRARR
jgi:SsrA-binding protein